MPAAIAGGAAARPVTIDTSTIKLFDRGDYLIGVSTRFGSQRPFGYDLDRGPAAMDRLSLNSFREDIYWQVSGHGSTDRGMIGARLATILDAARQRPVLILNGGSTALGDGLPRSDAARRSFADFATRAVRSTRGRAPIYEIWNEWNHPKDEKTAFADKGREDDPRYSRNYALLARAAIPAIRSADPDATILVGAAAADWDWEWLSGVVRRGGLKGADGVSVHLYNQCRADIRGADELMSRLQALQQRLRAENGGRTIDVYVTEWGWSTGSACRVTDDFVIANTAQFMLAAAATPWIRGTWQYELKDAGRNHGSQMDNFGILGFDFADKPATCATRDTAALLRTIRAIGELQVGGGVRLILARTAREYLAVAWAPQGSSAKIAVDRSGSVTARPICGAPRAARGGQPMALSAVPLVIHLGQTAPNLSIVR